MVHRVACLVGACPVAGSGGRGVAGQGASAQAGRGRPGHRRGVIPGPAGDVTRRLGHEGDHGHRNVGRCGGAVAELADTVAAPAVHGAITVDRACVEVAGADPDGCLARQDPAGVHGHRDVRVGGGSVTEPAGGVVSPAVDSAHGSQCADGPAGADLGEGLAGQHPAGVHGHRDVGRVSRPIAEPAEGPGAPAVGMTGGIQHAGLVEARADLGQDPARQHPAGVHGHRDVGRWRSRRCRAAPEVLAPQQYA